MIRHLTLIVLLCVFSPVSASDIVVGVLDQNKGVLSVEMNKFTGSRSGLFRCIFDNSGINYELRLMPQARILYLLERGEIDIGLPLSHQADRDQYAIFAEPFIQAVYVLLTSKDIDVTGDLSGYRFVTLRGSSRGGGLIAGKKIQFEEVATWVQAIELTKIGRFDGTALPFLVVSKLDPSLLDGLNVIDIGSVPISMYVSKKIESSQSLLEIMNAAIKSCVP